ncbi:MAG: TonB-dependent receptor, partial [Rikenellaceae bacterium]
GEPGNDNTEIYIRGIATFTGDTSPAYIIDGIERTSSDFARMDPNEIESINVLKDAASAAIFGMRGANGVIVITTKRGGDGKTTIKYSGSVSVQSATELPEFASSYDFARLYNEYTGTETYSAEAIQKYLDGSDTNNYPNTDWYDEMLTQNSVQQQHNISISGGNSNINYFVSGGYLDQGGFWEDINYNRFNLRSNIDAQITPTTRLTVDISGRKENTLNSGSASSVFQELMRNPSTMVCRYDNGLFASPTGSYSNVVAANQPGGSYSDGETFVSSARLSLDQKLDFITQGLSMGGTMSYSSNSYALKSWGESAYLYTIDGDGEYILSDRSSPSLYQQETETIDQEYQFQLNYSRDFGKHSFTGLAMAIAKLGSYKYADISRISFDYEILEQMNAGNSENQTLSAYDTATARASYLGRINYSYDNKYLAEFNIRRDGSENFAPDCRWGTFLAGSVGWVISEEEFFENLRSSIGQLKIRASYGTLGNDETGGVDYPYYSRYELYSSEYCVNGFSNNMGAYTFGSSLTNGLIPGAIANTVATWEKSTKTNIAIDAFLFNHLSVTAEYFYEKRTDILTQRDAEIPDSFGATLPLENIGEVENKGVDLNIVYSKTINEVNFSLGANFTYARNKIIEMAEAEGTSEYLKLTGRPIGGYYGYKTDGIFQTQDEIDNYAAQHVSSGDYVAQPGDIKYVDVNGDGEVNSDDMTYLGNGNTPEISYGITGAVRYKNMDFSFLLQGTARAQLWLSGNIIYPYYNSGNLQQFWITDSWTETNTDARYPRLADSNHNFPSDVCETYLYDASYLRLKNIEFGYTLPEKWASKLAMSSARIYVNAQNLFTITDVPLVDPENTSELGWAYPQLKSFNIGVSLQF